VLIADDQPAVLDALRLLLKEEGYRLVTATRPVEILKAVEANGLDAVLMDLNYARDTTSGKEGLDVLARVRASDSTLPIIVMTA
jgi:DNA-binding response OmpR family regulator